MSCKPCPPRGPRPFTLIELLVVVAIIAVLAAILLPALQQARRMAMRSSCMANQSQIGLGIAVYADDFEGFVPPNAIDGVGHTSLTQRQVVTWKDMQSGQGGMTPPNGTGYLSYWEGKHGGLTTLWPHYGGDRRVFTCPSGANKPVSGTLTPAATAKDNKYWMPTATSTGYLGYTYVAGTQVAGDYTTGSAQNQTNYRDGHGAYRPELLRKLDEVHTIPAGAAYLPMGRPTNYILLKDIARNRSAGHFAHEAKAGCAGINVLFSDNHVTWFDMQGYWWSNYQGAYLTWAGNVFIGAEGYITGWRY